MKQKNICIIGGGIAGLTASSYALSKGLNVVLFEHNNIGGKAFNGGDIYLNTFFQEIKSETIKEKNDLFLLFEKSNKIKNDLLNSRFNLSQNNSNFTLVNYKAEIINPNLIVANNKKYHCDNIIIAAGSKHNILEIDGLLESLENNTSLFSTELKNINKKANKIAIIGAGRVAFELAMILSEFKVETHVFATEKPLTHLDNEVKDKFFSAIDNNNIYIYTDSTIKKIKDNKLYYNDTFKTFDNIILASGFKFNNDVIKNLNIDVNDEGIIVNEFMQTSIKNIYAIGDNNDNSKFSNVAIKEALVAINHISGKRTKYNPFNFQRILGKYEYAYLGKNEQDLQKENIDYIKFTLDENDMVNDTEQIKFIKVLISKTTREILGVFVIAKNAWIVINSILLTLEETAEDVINSRLPLFTNTYYIANKISRKLKEIDLNVINNYYEPFYQIKVDANKKIVGAESLARFKFDNNFLSPLPFITNFEKNSLILDLDLKNIENACILLNELTNNNLIDENFHISVNLSSLTIDMLEYQTILSYFEKYNINPSQLVFEITERETLEDHTYFNKIKKFKSLGLYLSMDDFSVGNSSLSMYNDIDFKEVKLDMSLLPDDEDDLLKISVYKNLVDLLRRKEIILVSEGIEDKFHFEFTKTLNIDQYQGYYFSRPLPKDEFINTLKTNSKKTLP